MTSGFPPSLRGRLSFLLGKLYLGALDLEAAGLEPLGINVKHHAALTVLTDEGAMTQQDLGQRLGIDRTTIVAVVDVLENVGLVERRRSPIDRRAYLLTLTDAGRQARQRGQDVVDEAERRLLGALDESEQRLLADLLARAVAAETGSAPA
jgi:DNA-binding MarR family transcriptional regulator